MIRLPIHVRLTAWYLLSLTLIIALFASGTWYAMKVSMYHSIDRDLSYRMQAVAPFIESHSLDTPESFHKTFANSSDSSIVGVFVQITDAQSNILYESDVLSSHRVPVFAGAPSDGSISRATVSERGWPVRVASKQVTVNGTVVTDADLSHAILTDANLTRANLTNVFYDQSTRWPAGFVPPPSRPAP